MLRRKRFYYKNTNGDLAEKKVSETLSSLFKKKKILGFVHASRKEEMDLLGIDFLVFLLGGLSVPLQVKASQNHVADHFANHPLIRFIIAVREEKTASGIIFLYDIEYRYGFGKQERTTIVNVQQEFFEAALLRIFKKGIEHTKFF